VLPAALLQIAPDDAQGLGKVIAVALIPSPEAHGAYKLGRQAAANCAPWLRRSVPALEPALSDKREWVGRLTAYQILCLETRSPQCRDDLASAMQKGDPTTRAQAAVYYWRITGETNQVFSVLRENPGDSER